MCLEPGITEQRGLAARSAVVGRRITVAYVSYSYGSLEGWIHTNFHTGTYVTQTETEDNR